MLILNWQLGLNQLTIWVTKGNLKCDAFHRKVDEVLNVLKGNLGIAGHVGRSPVKGSSCFL
jgi:hypothetical protein